MATLTVLPVNAGYAPNADTGSVIANIAIDFSIDASPYALDLWGVLSSKQIDLVQSMYVDNSKNAAKLTISVDGSGFSIDVPANCQGTFPLLAKQGKFIITLATTGTPKVSVFMQNIPQPFFVWGPGLGGSVPTGNPRAVTNASGAIAVGGVAQNVVGVESAGHVVEIQNPFSALESLFVDDSGAADTAGTHSFELVPGGTYKSDFITNAVSVNAVTIAHAFVAKITR